MVVQSMTSRKLFRQLRQSRASTHQPCASGSRACPLYGQRSGAWQFSTDDLDTWARRAWPQTNTLTSDDGDKIRRAFEARLAQLATMTNQNPSPTELIAPAANDETRSRIDKSVLTLPEAKRQRGRQHLRFVAKQPCLVYGREPCDPHHLRFAQPRGLYGPARPGASSRTAPRR